MIRAALIAVRGTVARACEVIEEGEEQGKAGTVEEQFPALASPFDRPAGGPYLALGAGCGFWTEEFGVAEPQETMLTGATPVRIDGEHGNQALQEVPSMRTVSLIDFAFWTDHNLDIPRSISNSLF
jgi:hypothetical protein